MLEASDLVFPNNAVELIATRAQTIDSDLFVARRPLRKADPIQAIGVYASYWTPNENSYEMLGGAPPRASQPTLSTYVISIEGYIKDMDQERGLSTHALLSTYIRSMLYRDAPLLVALRSLSVQIGNATERVGRSGVRSQRFSANELESAFLYLSTLEYWLETETK